MRTVLKLLSGYPHTGLLSLDQTIDVSGKTVRDILEDKHPDSEPVNLLDDAGDDSFKPAIFDITADSIWTAALHTQGAAGPSGVWTRCSPMEATMYCLWAKV